MNSSISVCHIQDLPSLLQPANFLGQAGIINGQSPLYRAEVVKYT